MKRDSRSMAEELLISMQADDAQSKYGTTPSYIVQRQRQQRIKHSRLSRFLAAAAAVTAFCTTYILILPAITMETDDKRALEPALEQVSTVTIPEEIEAQRLSSHSVNTQNDSGASSQDAKSISVTSVEPASGVSSEATTGNLSGKDDSSHNADSSASENQARPSGSQDATNSSETSEAADYQLLTEWNDSLEVLGLGGSVSDNLVTIANSQRNVRESSEDTKEINDETKGRTLFGEWAGDPYIDWNVPFVCFALEYAGLPGYKYTSAVDLANSFVNAGIYVSSDQYLPLVGNVVFIDSDTNGDPDSVGIIVSRTDTVVTVLEGDKEGAVVANEYSVLSLELYGYGLISDKTTSVAPLCLTSEHTHTAECFNAEDEEELKAVEPRDSVNTQANAIVCGKEEHTHSDDCYDIEMMCGQYAESVAYTAALEEEAAAYEAQNATKQANTLATSPLALYASPMATLKSQGTETGRYSEVFMPNTYEYRNDKTKNVYLRALEYLGYNIEGRRQMSESVGAEPMALPLSPFKSRNAEADFHGLSGMETNVRSHYWNERYPAGRYISKTYANDFMCTGLTMNTNELVGTPSNYFGLACAGFTSFVYWTYIPTELGISLEGVLKKPQKTGIKSGGNLVKTANPDWSQLYDVKGSGGDYTRAQGWWNAMLLTKMELQEKDPEGLKWTWYDFDAPERQWSASESGLGKPSAVNSNGQIKGEAPEIGTILCFFNSEKWGPAHMAIYAGRFPAYKTVTGDVFSTDIETDSSGKARVLSSPNEYRDYIYDVGSAYGPALRVIPGFKLGGISLDSGISFTPPTVELKIHKEDEEGTPLPGVTYELYEYEYDHVSTEPYTGEYYDNPYYGTVAVKYYDGKYKVKPNLKKIATAVTDDNGEISLILPDKDMSKVTSFKYDVVDGNGEQVPLQWAYFLSSLYSAVYGYYVPPPEHYIHTYNLPRYKLVETGVPSKKTTLVRSGYLGAVQDGEEYVPLTDENGIPIDVDIQTLDVYVTESPHASLQGSLAGLEYANEILSQQLHWYMRVLAQNPDPDLATDNGGANAIIDDVGKEDQQTFGAVRPYWRYVSASGLDYGEIPVMKSLPSAGAGVARSLATDPLSIREGSSQVNSSQPETSLKASGLDAGTTMRSSSKMATSSALNAPVLMREGGVTFEDGGPVIGPELDYNPYRRVFDGYAVTNISKPGLKVLKTSSDGRPQSDIGFAAVWVGSSTATAEQVEAYVVEKGIGPNYVCTDPGLTDVERTARSAYKATTDVNGSASFVLETSGVYRVYETTTLKGVPRDWTKTTVTDPNTGESTEMYYTDVVVNLDAMPPTVVLNVINDDTKLKLRKIGQISTANSTVAPLAGAEFALSSTTGEWLTLGPTNSLGYTNTVDLHPGETYKVYETMRPAGYESAAEEDPYDSEFPLVGTITVEQQADNSHLVHFVKNPAFEYAARLFQDTDGTWAIEVENKPSWTSFTLSKSAKSKDGQPLYYFREKGPNPGDGWERVEVDFDNIMFEVEVKIESNSHKGTPVPWYRVGSTNKNGPTIKTKIETATGPYPRETPNPGKNSGFVTIEREETGTVGGAWGPQEREVIGIRPGDSIVLSPLPPGVKVSFRETGNLHFLTPSDNPTVFDTFTNPYNVFEALPLWDYRDGIRFDGEAVDETGKPYPFDGEWYSTRVEESMNPAAVFSHFKNSLYNQPHTIYKRMTGAAWPEGGVQFRLYPNGDLPYCVRNADGSLAVDYQIAPDGVVTSVPLEKEGQYIEYYPTESFRFLYDDLQNSMLGTVLVWEDDERFVAFSSEAQSYNLAETAKLYESPIEMYLNLIYHYDEQGNPAGALVDACTAVQVDTPDSLWVAVDPFSARNTTEGTSEVKSDITFQNSTPEPTFFKLKKLFKGTRWNHDVRYPFDILVEPDEAKGLPAGKELPYQILDAQDNVIENGALFVGEQITVYLKENESFFLDNLPIGAVVKAREINTSDLNVTLERYILEQGGVVVGDPYIDPDEKRWEEYPFARIGLAGGGNILTAVNSSNPGEFRVKKTWENTGLANPDNFESVFLIEIMGCDGLPDGSTIKGVTTDGRELSFVVGVGNRQKFSLFGNSELVFKDIPQQTEFKVYEVEDQNAGSFTLQNIRLLMPDGQEDPYFSTSEVYIESDQVYPGFAAYLKEAQASMRLGTPLVLEFVNTPQFRPFWVDKRVERADYMPQETLDARDYQFKITIKGNDPFLPDGVVIHAIKSDGTPVDIVVGQETFFTLKHKQKLSMEGLGMTTEVLVDEIVPEDVTMERSDRADGVRFYNSFELSELKFEKVLADPEGIIDPDTDFEFDVYIEPNEYLRQNARLYADSGSRRVSLYAGKHGTVNLKAGEIAVIDSLPIGTRYTITELNTGYSTGWQVVKPSDGSVVDPGGDGNVYDGEITSVSSDRKTVFTNKPDVGSVEVVKTLNDPQNLTPADAFFEFTFLLSPKDNVRNGAIVKGTLSDGTSVDVIVGQPYQFRLKANEKFTLSAVPAGMEYTVREISAGFGTTIKHYEGSQEKSVIPGDTATNTVVSDIVVKDEFVNKPETGDLAIVKTLEDNTNQMDPNTTFSFKLDIDPNEPFLPTGTKVSAEVSTISSAGVVGGVTRTEEITVGTPFEFSLKGNEQLKIVGLPVKTHYSITETTLEYETFIKHYIDGVYSGQVRSTTTDGYVLANQLIKEEIVNRVAQGGLVIKKRLEDPNNFLTSDPDFSFSLTIDELGSRLPAGQTVTAHIKDIVSGTVLGQVDVVIGKDRIGDAANKFTLKANQMLELVNLPTGAHYTVSETSVGFKTVINHTVSQATNTVIEGQVVEGIISSEYIATEEFVNEPEVGNLEIVKLLDMGETGYDPAQFKDLYFNFTLYIEESAEFPAGTEIDAYITGGDQPLKTVKIKVGVDSPFQLLANQKLTLARVLPDNNYYRIEEVSFEQRAFQAKINRYLDGIIEGTVDDRSVSDLIQVGHMRTEEFVNTPTTDLVVEKKTIGLTDEEKAEKEFVFQVRIGATDFNRDFSVKATKLMRNPQGELVTIGVQELPLQAGDTSIVHTFMLKSDQLMRFDNLLMGTPVVVEEIGGVTGYYTTATTEGLIQEVPYPLIADNNRTVHGLIDKPDNKVVFTNEKKNTKLFISKFVGDSRMIADRLGENIAPIEPDNPAGVVMNAAKPKQSFDFILTIMPDAQTLPAGTVIPFDIVKAATVINNGTSFTAGQITRSQEVVVGIPANFKLHIYDDERVYEVIRGLNLPLGTKCIINERKAGGYVSEVVANQDGIKINDAAVIGYTLDLSQEFGTYVDFFNKEEWFNLEFEKKVTNPLLAEPNQRYEFSLLVESLADRPDFVEYTGSVYDAAGNPVDGTLPENAKVVVNSSGQNILGADGSFTARPDSLVKVYLRDGDRCVVNRLPSGTQYTIDEARSDSYVTTITETRAGKVGNPTSISAVSGSIDSEVGYVFGNTVTENYELPKSGGGGIAIAISAGVAALAAVVTFLMSGPLLRRAKEQSAK